MTPEQKAAYIYAQATLMNAERMMMEQENAERLRDGYTVAYGVEQMGDWHKEWESVLGCNALLQFFND